jgi:TPR repeat protein
MARVLLGFAFATGAKHLTKDEAKGLQTISSEMAWLQDEASRGNKIAQNNFGVCYNTCQGVELNLEKAARLYRLAADQGFASSKLQIFTISELSNLISRAITVHERSMAV